jgi:nucleoside-diphosphate-sugar epimerase
MRGIGLTYLNTYGYGEPDALPIGETAALRPNTPYNHSKYVAEDIIRFYCSVFGMNAVSLRAFNIFGFGQNEIFLLPSLVKQTLDTSVDSIHVKVLEPKRDYIYIDDVVSALVATLNAPDGFNAYNVGSGRSFSVKDVGETIMRLAGVEKPIVADGNVRPNDVPDIVADISKIRLELGWVPNVGFEEGLRLMIEQSRKGEVRRV